MVASCKRQGSSSVSVMSIHPLLTTDLPQTLAQCRPKSTKYIYDSIAFAIYNM